MGSTEAAIKAGAYKAKCAVIQSKLRQLDRDYEEVTQLGRKIMKYQAEFADKQNNRVAILNGGLHAMGEILAYRRYREQMTDMLKGAPFQSAMSGLDSALSAVEREKERIRMESSHQESELNYAEYMYSYWQQQANSTI